MSEHTLPDDLGQWPGDPYALLGVSNATKRRDVRRAYSRLIRVYKPEHYPDHFRRLRDAYETLDQRAAWMESSDAPTEETVETAPFAEAIAAPAADAQAVVLDDELTQAHEPVRFAATDRDAVWREAQRGNLAAAYSQYAQAAQQGQADEELYARLFWLLRIDRQLDPARDPRDWLVAGMKRCGLRGRLPELYRNELSEDPPEALRRRCDDALRCSGHNGLLVELVMARWDAAVRLEKWELIGQDLAALRGRLHDDSAIWGRLLLAAIDHLTWAKQPVCTLMMANCRQEIEQLAEHWQPITTELDQRDGLAELVNACDQLAHVTNLSAAWRKSLRALLMNSWNQPLENFRHQLLDVLVPLVQNPIAGLECLDRLESRCRSVLHRFGALIGMLANECGIGHEAPPAKELLDRLVDFLVAASNKRYPMRWKNWLQAAQQNVPFGRRELLIFCLQESISARQLIDYLAGSLRQDLEQFIKPAENVPLHFMCLAYLAFWE